MFGCGSSIAVRRLFTGGQRVTKRWHSMNSTTFTEVRIPVPWGHVAGKWWGPQNQRPILALHGWQDSCGSFDTLIPVLPKHLSFLAIDSPGHGHSSWLPLGQFYHGIDLSLLIKQLQVYFKWDKVSLMGHSMGGIGAFTFGFLFPDDVDFSINIDGMHPLIPDDPIKTAVDSINSFIKFDAQASSQEDQPCYTLEEMKLRLHEGTRKSIDLDKCHYILDRNIKPSKKYLGKYYFSRDPRLKCGQLMVWNKLTLLEAAKRVKYPILINIAEYTPFFRSKEYFEDIIVILKQVSADFQYNPVPGMHHGHLNNPENLKDVITAFIAKHDKTYRNKYQIPKEILIS